MHTCVHVCVIEKEIIKKSQTVAKTCWMLLFHSEGNRQSAVVTKTFEVEFAPPPEVLPVDDDMEFQNDLKRERSRVCAVILVLCFIYFIF